MSVPRRARLASQGLAAAFVLSQSLVAFAYCRATTCDPAKGSCGKSAHGCQTEGDPLKWSDGDVELRVDQAGSELLQISAGDTQAAVEAALTTWMNAECGGGLHPSFTGNTELAANLRIVFNEDGKNVNAIKYIDDIWPYEPGAVAKTLLGFDSTNGDLLDADVAFNSAEYPLAIDPKSAGQIELEAVLTHEVGHILGLAHSDAPGATMQPETTGFATAELKTLEPDDMAGICSIYPPETAGTKRPSTSASTTDASDTASSASSGCALAPTRTPRANGFEFVVAAAALVALRRRLERRAA